MLSRIITNTATQCPVPLDVLRKHAFQVQTSSDDLLNIYATAATELAENFTNRYFLNRSLTWTLSQDTMQNSLYMFAASQMFYNAGQPQSWINLPHSATAITAVTTGTWGVTPDTVLVAGTDYNVDTTNDPARIQLLTFGSFDPDIDHLAISYLSGMGVVSADIPYPIWQAIMIMTARGLENRGDQDGGLWSPAAEALLSPYMVIRLGGSTDFRSA